MMRICMIIVESKSNHELHHIIDIENKKKIRQWYSSYMLWMSFQELNLLKSILETMALWVTIIIHYISYPQCQPLIVKIQQNSHLQ